MRKGLRLASGLAIAVVIVGTARTGTKALRAQGQNDVALVAQDAPAPAPAPPEASKAAPAESIQPPQHPTDLLPPPSTEPPQPEAAPSPAPDEDPEQVAKAYVEKTRREAEASIKTLREEQNTLRERLKKVEAALLRWEALRAAVDPDPFSQVKHGKFQPIQTTVEEGGAVRTTEAGSAVLEPVPTSPEPPRLKPVAAPTSPPPTDPSHSEGPKDEPKL
jgi:hypothetical protein